jgi:hypothetical protein
MTPILIFALYYAVIGVYVGGVQLHYNRHYGRGDMHYAEAWFVGLAWWPLMLWVLGRRLWTAAREGWGGVD